MTAKQFPALLGGWILILLLAGCDGPAEPAAKRQFKKPGRLPETQSSDAPAQTPKSDPTPEPTAESKQSEPTPSKPKQPKRKARLLADLLDQPADSAARMIPNLPRMKVDAALASAEGIRRISGKRLTLYTDMASSEKIDSLPKLIDQAFPQWCDYFGIDPAKQADWHLTGFLMEEKAAFVRAGLLPDDLPPFQHGYARNHELWLYDQPSDYYRRHLLLHEGTHCFMNTLLGACGPPWYMEGVAELLATHRWHQGRLTLNHMPANREEVPMWGRIKIVKRAFADRKAMSLKKVINYSPRAHLETAPYAWCWTAAALMDRNPRYQKRFRQLQKNVLQADFNQRFFELIGDDWNRLDEEWQVLVGDLEYGHQIARTAIDFTPGDPLPSTGATVTVAADAGWQNSRIRLEAGSTYRLSASGRYQVADKPQIWWCEPGGVSIRYYQGRPLGILLAVPHPDEPTTGAKGASSFVRPIVVGRQAELKPDRPVTLFFKINDSAAELGDNAGELKVKIERD